MNLSVCSHIDKYAKPARQDDSTEYIRRLITQGYKFGIWNTHESHEIYDICDELNGNVFELEALVTDLKYNAPIFETSHVNCLCHLICYGDDSLPWIVVDWRGMSETGRYLDRSDKRQRSKDFYRLYDTYREKYQEVETNKFLTGTQSSPETGIYSFDVTMYDTEYTVNQEQKLNDSILDIILTKAQQYGITVDEARLIANDYVVSTDAMLSIYDFSKEDLMDVNWTIEERRKDLQGIIVDLDKLQDWLVYTQDAINQLLIQYESGIQVQSGRKYMNDEVEEGWWISPDNEYYKLKDNESHFGVAFKILNPNFKGTDDDLNKVLTEAPDGYTYSSADLYGAMVDRGWIRVSKHNGEIGIEGDEDDVNCIKRIERFLIDNLEVLKNSNRCGIFFLSRAITFTYQDFIDNQMNLQKTINQVKRITASRQDQGFGKAWWVEPNGTIHEVTEHHTEWANNRLMNSAEHTSLEGSKRLLNNGWIRIGDYSPEFYVNVSTQYLLQYIDRIKELIFALNTNNEKIVLETERKDYQFTMNELYEEDNLGTILKRSIKNPIEIVKNNNTVTFRIPDKGKLDIKKRIIGDYEYYQVIGIYINSDHRRQGLATELYSYATEYAKKQGLELIHGKERTDSGDNWIGSLPKELQALKRSFTGITVNVEEETFEYEEPLEIYFKFKLGTKVVGYLKTVRYDIDEDFYIKSIDIVERYQRTGIATYMFEYASNYVKKYTVELLHDAALTWQGELWKNSLPEEKQKTRKSLQEQYEEYALNKSKQAGTPVERELVALKQLAYNENGYWITPNNEWIRLNPHQEHLDYHNNTGLGIVEAMDKGWIQFREYNNTLQFYCSENSFERVEQILIDKFLDTKKEISIGYNRLESVRFTIQEFIEEDYHIRPFIGTYRSKIWSQKLKQAGKQVGLLYHFTSRDNLEKILETNTLKGGYSLGKEWISFTRNPNLNPAGKGFGGSGVIITVDGDKLSNNYKIEPYAHEAEFIKDNPDADIVNRNSLDEMEERVEGPITNIKDYIVNIKTSAKQVGTLYHFTNLKAAVGIIQSNQLTGRAQFGISINPGTISFTRDKNFANQDRLTNGLGVCFVIDGDKLSNNYKIQPVDDFSKVQDKTFFMDEMEESVNRDIPNIKDYIVKVILNTQAEIKDRRFKHYPVADLTEQLKQLCKDNNIPLEIKKRAIKSDQEILDKLAELSKSEDFTVSVVDSYKEPFERSYWIKLRINDKEYWYDFGDKTGWEIFYKKWAYKKDGKTHWRNKGDMLQDLKLYVK